MAHHDEAGEAEAKGPALVFFVVYSTSFEDVFVDHAGSHKFDPTGVFADATAFLVAK